MTGNILSPIYPATDKSNTNFCLYGTYIVQREKYCLKKKKRGKIYVMLMTDEYKGLKYKIWKEMLGYIGLLKFNVGWLYQGRV